MSKKRRSKKPSSKRKVQYEFRQKVSEPEHEIVLSESPRVEVAVKTLNDTLLISTSCSECGSHITGFDIYSKFVPCQHLKEAVGVEGRLTRKRLFNILKEKYFESAGITLPEPTTSENLSSKPKQDFKETQTGRENDVTATRTQVTPLAIFELPYSIYPQNSAEKILLFQAGNKLFLVSETLLTEGIRENERVEFLKNALNFPEFQIAIEDVVESLKTIQERYGEPVRIRPYFTNGMSFQGTVLAMSLALAKAHEIGSDILNPISVPELNTSSFKKCLQKAVESAGFIEKVASRFSRRAFQSSHKDPEAVRHFCRQAIKLAHRYETKFLEQFKGKKTLSPDHYYSKTRELLRQESYVSSIPKMDVFDVLEGGKELLTNPSFLKMCKDFVGIHISHSLFLFPPSRSEFELIVPRGNRISNIERSKYLLVQGTDISINPPPGYNGVEVRTGWLLSLKSMFERYRDLFDVFARARAKSNISCGFHHHVHMKRFLEVDRPTAPLNPARHVIPKALYGLWVVLERPFITKIVHESRIGNRYCKFVKSGLSRSTVQTIERALTADTYREALELFRRIKFDEVGERHVTCNTEPFYGPMSLSDKKYGTFEFRVFNVPYNAKTETFNKVSAVMAGSVVLGSIYAPLMGIQKAFTSNEEWRRFQGVLSEFLRNLKESTRRVQRRGIKGKDDYFADLRVAFDVLMDYAGLNDLSPNVKRFIFKDTPFNSFSDVMAFRVVDLYFKLSEKIEKGKLPTEESVKSVEETFDLGGVSYVR